MKLSQQVCDERRSEAELTERQAEVLEFIRTRLRETGLTPTVREIELAFRFKSPNSVMCHIRALIRKGYIRRVNRGLSHKFFPVFGEGCCPTCGHRLED